MKDKILVTGTVMSTNDNQINIYKNIVNICKKINDNVYSPLDTLNFNGNDKERYERAMKLLQEANEMTVSSTGQGMELQEAIRLDIPIIIIAKHNSKISSLIKGAGKVKSILYYDEIEDIKDELIQILQDCK